jgi:hypothetical protein
MAWKESSSSLIGVFPPKSSVRSSSPLISEAPRREEPARHTAPRARSPRLDSHQGFGRRLFPLLLLPRRFECDPALPSSRPHTTARSFPTHLRPHAGEDRAGVLGLGGAAGLVEDLQSSFGEERTPRSTRFLAWLTSKLRCRPGSNSPNLPCVLCVYNSAALALHASCSRFLGTCVSRVSCNSMSTSKTKREHGLLSSPNLRSCRHTAFACVT